MKRAHLLARVSTCKRAQDASPERQIAELRAYCERQGWQVVGEGVERQSGGKGEAERPALAAAMAAARSGRVDVIAVTHLDRLGRNLSHLLDVSAELQRLGVGLVILSMQVDTTTAMGRLVFQVLGAVAEFQRTSYGERAVAAKAAAEAKGKHCARPREFMADDAAAAARRMRVESPGLSWRGLSAKLWAAGYGQPGRLVKGRGEYRAERPWPPATLQRLIDPPKPRPKAPPEIGP